MKKGSFKGLLFREFYIARKNYGYNLLAYIVMVAIGLLALLSYKYGNLHRYHHLMDAETKSIIDLMIKYMPAYTGTFFFGGASDALGLSLFTVLGTETVCAAGFHDKALFCILMGMITGVGGGIFRDVLADKTPYVLKKHVYALASLCGSALYYFVHPIIDGMVVPAVISMALVFAIRMLATKYLWQLPKIELEENE